MRELRTPGFVRGVPGDGHSYRVMPHAVISDTSCSVIPAKAGIHLARRTSWIPACAGMTILVNCDRVQYRHFGR